MRRLLALLAAALVALPAAAAAAATGQIVASASGFDLYARHGAHGGVCLTVLGTSDSSSGSRCQRVFSAFHPAMTFEFTRRAPVAVAVPATVARVTADDGAGVDTISADGFSVRFALLAGAGRDPLLRFFDAGGTLVGAARSEYGDFISGGTPVFRAPATRVRVRRTYDLEPSPLDFDRTVPSSCLTVRVDHGGTTTCTRDSDLGPLDVELTTACAPARPLLYGLVAARVRRVAMVLGDGTSRTVPTRPLAARLGPGRLVAAPLPPGLAVRSVRGLDAAGRVTGRKRLGAAPSGLPCPSDDDASSGFAIAYVSDQSEGGPKPISDPVVVAPTDDGALRASDGPGATLCTGIRPRLGCAVPPVDATTTFLDRRGAVVGSVVSQDVASVSFVLGDGTTVDAATTDGAAYTGRFAGRVRFLAATLPAGAVVERAVPRDADGRRVGTLYVDADERSETSARRRIAPGVSLVTSGAGEDASSFACLRPRRPLSPIGSIGVCARPRRLGTGAIVSVACAPRRAVAFGTLPEGRRVRLRLTGGVTLRPKVQRARGLGRVWTAVLPRDRGLVSYRVGGRTRSLRLPPASEQCGYEDVSQAF